MVGRHRGKGYVMTSYCSKILSVMLPASLFLDQFAILLCFIVVLLTYLLLLLKLTVVFLNFLSSFDDNDIY